MGGVHLVISIILATSLSSTLPNNREGDLEMVKTAIVNYFHNRTSSTYFIRTLKTYQLPHMFRNGMEKLYNKGHICFLCNLVVNLIIGQRKLGISKETIGKEMEFLCVHLGIESRRVCKGVIDLNLDIFAYIVDHSSTFSSNKLCGLLLQNYDCATEAFEWSVAIPSGNSTNRSKSKNKSLSAIKILQLSDIHYDPYYKPKGNADCGEPVCCQTDQGEYSSPETACGYWTDYRDADVPWHLIEETIKHIQTQQFDYVYYTGDIISHRIWDSSIENNTRSISQLYTFFKKSFKVPVYPIFGNHEPHPLNAWPSECVNDERFPVQWLFKLAAGFWSELVGEDISATVLQGGFYTVSPKPGFRIIAINSNLCYTVNWWLLYDDVDPYSQLRWLADTLKQSEDNDESVHILSHVPTGSSSCLKVWAREYSRIVERFSNTITGQFNGHTHEDEFHIYYSSSNHIHPVGVIFNGASLTPYSNSNPSYKIYQVDSSSFLLLDYEEWTFNLTLANTQLSTQPPTWYKLYSFVEAYGVKDLSPIEVDRIVYKMVDNHSLLDEYFRFKFRNSDSGINTSCDENCKRDNLCEIVTTVYGDNTKCYYFLKLYDQVV